MAVQGKKFRNTFKVAKEIINWYPGHMKSSFTHMQAKMRIVDCVIEVHDSRIPFSGRNPLFLKNFLGTKPHVLVLNKVDLIDRSNYVNIEEKFQEGNCENVIFTNCLDQKCKGLKSVIPLVIDLIQQTPRPPALEVTKYRMMVVGIPNVGKSSLINALRNITIHKGKASAVGGTPGITRSVLNEIKISETPPIYLIDTPGILLPNISDIECGMKLALCSCLRDENVGIVTVADFLLYWMNKTENFCYVKEFDLMEPTDSIFPLLIKIAISNNKMKKVKNIVKNTVEVIPDVYSAAHIMVALFRKGKFGDLYLDSECI